MTIDEWLSQASANLQKHHISSYQLDAQLLVCHVTHHSREWLLAHPDYLLHSAEKTKLGHALKRRLTLEPVAYIIGKKEFYGRSFIVNESTLIPRPESESLVELVLSLSSKPLKVIDLGCGSGAIGITLALERPNWTVTLSDISRRALQVTKLNATHYQLQRQIRFRCQDLLEHDPTDYQVIVANLPYVPNALRHKPDLQAEPPESLFSGEDGLHHYRSLLSQLAQRTPLPTDIFLEALTSQHETLIQIAANNGYNLIKIAGLALQFQT